MDLTKTLKEAYQDTLHSQNEREAGKQIVRMLFKDYEGKPFELTDGQADIFLAIFLRRHLRWQGITYTQYGKSEVTAMAIDARAIAFGEDWTIVAGQQDKCDIIMGKALGHLFDNPALEAQIDPLSVPKLERLKHEKSRDRVTFTDGGEIRTLTASSQNRKRVRDVVTGQGARSIVQDESSLIPDDLQAMIMRMLGGFPDGFIFKIGNPFYNNHFKRTWQSSKYKKIFIDYHQGIKEGRITKEFIEEMRNEPFFDVLYECEFPKNDEVLTGGYRKLISDDLLESSFITEEEAKAQGLMTGRARLGSDVAGGGNDRSAHVIRWPKCLKLLETNKIADTMQQVGIIERLQEEYSIQDFDISLDYGGLGQGVGDRLSEKDHSCNLVMFGERSPEPDKYKNMRAYMYYSLYVWLKDGGKIIRNDGFYELSVVNYKEDSERKFQIQPKQELKKIANDLNLGISSPDIADAAALTFADNSHLVTSDDFGFL